MTMRKEHLVEKKQNQKSNCIETDFWDSEQVTSKSHIHVDNRLAIRLKRWYRNLPWGLCVRKRHHFRKTEFRIQSFHRVQQMN